MKRKLKIGDIFTDFEGQKVIVGTNRQGKIILKKYNPMNYTEGGVF